jgi:phosphopantetheinyl transferase
MELRTLNSELLFKVAILKSKIYNQKSKITFVPIFFQHQINDTTRLGIWKIEETEEFFLSNVPLQQEVTHPLKRLQHLAGRFLLQFLCPGFPYELIRIADTRKPYLPNEQYHFSISHCGDYAAAIVSNDQRVGVDIEITSKKAERIKNKFLTQNEQLIFSLTSPSVADHVPQSALAVAQGLSKAQRDPVVSGPDLTTLLWCAKESVYKWFGDGGVDFRKHIQLEGIDANDETIIGHFAKTKQDLIIHYRHLDHLILTWIIS